MTHCLVSAPRDTLRIRVYAHRGVRYFSHLSFRDPRSKRCRFCSISDAEIFSPFARSDHTVSLVSVPLLLRKSSGPNCEISQSLACPRELKVTPFSECAHLSGGTWGRSPRAQIWRRHPESNRSTRLCRPLRNHSAMAPERSILAAEAGESDPRGLHLLRHHLLRDFATLRETFDLRLHKPNAVGPELV